MTKTPITQSQKRFDESLAPLFNMERESAKKCLFIKSSSDIGVIRNGGRNGARFAPLSLLSFFKKLTQNEKLKNFVFIDKEVSTTEAEKKDFHAAQALEASKIDSLIGEHAPQHIIHLGGGHDHIYPLLKAISRTFEKVIVINIDAHADSRTDDQFHSGTPFRQFENDFEGFFYLLQVGLHPFANSFSTLSPFSKGSFEIIWKADLSPELLDIHFQKLTTLIDQKTLVVFSLDADALNGSEIPGVSAVNPSGLTRNQVIDLWKRYRKLPLNHPTIFGIYELNPLYDTLSGLSMRTAASLLYECLME